MGALKNAAKQLFIGLIVLMACSAAPLDDDDLPQSQSTSPFVVTGLGTVNNIGNVDEFPINVTVSEGATLVVMVSNVNEFVASVAWTDVGPLTQVQNTSSGALLGSMWILVDAPAGTHNAVVTFEASVDALAITALQISGGNGSPIVLDKSAVAIGTSTTPSSGNTAVTTAANEALIGAVATNGPIEDNPGTWSGSFTNGQRDGITGTPDNCTMSDGYRIVTAAGAYAAAKTGITSQPWVAMIATFKNQ